MYPEQEIPCDVRIGDKIIDIKTGPEMGPNQAELYKQAVESVAMDAALTGKQPDRASDGPISADLAVSKMMASVPRASVFVASHVDNRGVICWQGVFDSEIKATTYIETKFKDFYRNPGTQVYICGYDHIEIRALEVQ